MAAKLQWADKYSSHCATIDESPETKKKKWSVEACALSRLPLKKYPQCGIAHWIYTGTLHMTQFFADSCWGFVYKITVVSSNFNFWNHESQVIKFTRVHARDLYRISPLLDLKTSVLLANALVRSRLDYCNSLFLSLTDFELRRLQLVQKSLCRVVIHSSKFSHITPQLKKTPLAPARYRVQFKISFITYNILNQVQPVYLRELIHPCTSSGSTRRSTPKLRFLLTPTFDHRVHKSIKHISNSFSHYAPVLWNSFPFQIRNSPSVTSFRKYLKTHLFNSSFPI